MKSAEILKELHETRATIKFLQHQTCVLGRKARELGARYNQAIEDEAKARKEELTAENKEKNSYREFVVNWAKEILKAKEAEARKIGA